jgi:hypothetical protein
VVTRHGDTIYVSGLPPFDPETGEVVDAPIERQTELVMEQLKLCVETAGSSLENVLRCNVYCTSVAKFAAVNANIHTILPEGSARPYLCLRPGMAWAFLYRNRLRSGNTTSDCTSHYVVRQPDASSNKPWSSRGDGKTTTVTQPNRRQSLGTTVFPECSALPSSGCCLRLPAFYILIGKLRPSSA